MTTLTALKAKFSPKKIYEKFSQQNPSALGWDTYGANELLTKFLTVGSHLFFPVPVRLIKFNNDFDEQKTRMKSFIEWSPFRIKSQAPDRTNTFISVKT